LSEETAVVRPVESATRSGAETAEDDRATTGDADGAGRLVLDDSTFIAGPEPFLRTFSFSLSRAGGWASEPQLGKSASIEAASSKPESSSRSARAWARIAAALGIFLRLHPSVGMAALLPGREDAAIG
jgi:hypothetical protein